MTQHVKQIVGVGFWAVVALGAPSGWAQDFTAGKTPAQLFRSDCSECHRTPNGLAKNRDVATLAGFLREHYTTKAESAVALAAYVSGFSGRGPADVRNRAASATAAEPPTGERRPAVPRSRREAETAAGAEDGRPSPRGADDQPVRRRATIATQSVGDAANPRPLDPRNPRRSPNGGAAVAAAPAAPAAPQAPSSATSAATSAATDASRVAVATPAAAPTASEADLSARLRTYVYSGLALDKAISEADKTLSPNSRKRRDTTNSAEVPAGLSPSGDAGSGSASVPGVVSEPVVTAPAVPQAH